MRIEADEQTLRLYGASGERDVHSETDPTVPVADRKGDERASVPDGTAASTAAVYPRDMHSHRFQISLSTLYVATIAIVAPMIGLTTVAGWLALVTLTVVPLMIATVLWRDAQRTLAASTEPVRR